jgi:hypothetical protein
MVNKTSCCSYPQLEFFSVGINQGDGSRIIREKTPADKGLLGKNSSAG